MVLTLFLREPTRAWFGREIVEELGIKAGSLYPIVHRLEVRGLLKSSWERQETAVAEGRRARRLYVLRSVPNARQLLSEREQAEALAVKQGLRTALGGAGG
jgi:PadR family transcriptional regulator